MGGEINRKRANAMFERIRSFLRQSPRVHLRVNGVNSPRDFIELADRFIQGPLRYPLEWDDFISWRNDNPNLEAVRLRIGDVEPLLFSGDAAKRRKYAEVVRDERNRLAAALGLPPSQ